MTQLELALEAEVSTRHVSFLETGRSQPSREMIHRLSEELQIPLRERNALLVAAGFAPAHPQRELNGGDLEPVREAVDLVLAGHEPYPALAVDRYWNLVAANGALEPFFGGVSAELLEPPVNVLRASFHPDGLAPRIANMDQWRPHMLARVRRQIEVTGDRVLMDLERELRDFPPAGTAVILPREDEFPGIVVPLRLRTGDGVRSFLYTTTLFGSPLDVTVSELAIESFFPADRTTADALRRAHDARLSDEDDTRA
jgi:transcriptional regulator with XRE-family HTH domain